jgi:hypothetical protein
MEREAYGLDIKKPEGDGKTSGTVAYIAHMPVRGSA